jgi:hypothetical protein
MRRRSIAALGAVAALASAESAAALTVTTQGPNYSEMLYNTNDSSSGTTVDTFSKPGNYLVDWTSEINGVDLFESGNGGQGHAWIAGTSGTPLKDVLITPVANPADTYTDLLGFTKFGVDIDFGAPGITVPKNNGGTQVVNPASTSFEATFTFSNRGPLTITLPGPYLLAKDYPNSGMFNFIADPVTDGYIKSIEFFNATYYSDKDQSGVELDNYGFQDFKQPSFDAAIGSIPEPGAWALMILGLGGAGAVLRRRRTLAATA